jgi:hypothetical protein
MVLGRCSFNLGPLDERRTGLEVCLCVADLSDRGATGFAAGAAGCVGRLFGLAGAGRDEGVGVDGWAGVRPGREGSDFGATEE